MHAIQLSPSFPMYCTRYIPCSGSLSHDGISNCRHNFSSNCRGSALNEPRLRRERGTPSRGPSWRCPVSRSCLIGEPLALRAGQCEIGALHVVDAKPDAMRVTEVELVQIPLQVRLRDVLVDAVNAALEDREIAFNGVGVDVAANVFLTPMVDGADARQNSSRCRRRWDFRRS